MRSDPDASDYLLIRRYLGDVRAFAPLSESSSQLVPAQYAVFTESSAAASELISKTDPYGLVAWLNEPAQGKQWFDSLIISDLAGMRSQPDEA